MAMPTSFKKILPVSVFGFTSKNVQSFQILAFKHAVLLAHD